MSATKSITLLSADLPSQHDVITVTMTASSHVPHSELIEALLAQQSHPQNPSHKDEITVQLLILSYIHEMVFA